MGTTPTSITEAGRLRAPAPGVTLAATGQDFEWKATMAYMLTHDFWPAAGSLRRPYSDDDPLAAMRGIIMGSLLSILGFWLPLAIALTR